MKIYVNTIAAVWINGKEIVVKQGFQDVDEEVGKILVNAGYAYLADEKSEKKSKQ